MNEFTKRKEEKSMASVLEWENGSGLFIVSAEDGRKNWANFSAKVNKLCTRENQSGTEIILKEHRISKKNKQNWYNSFPILK